MKTVELLKHYANYNAGELAAFPAELADKLVEAGVAKPVVEAPAPKKKKDEQF